MMPHWEEISLAIQIAALLFALIYGITRGNRYLAPVCLSAGLVANVVGQLIIAGGGPGACVGFVLLPIYAWISGELGCLIRHIFRKRKGNR